MTLVVVVAVVVVAMVVLCCWLRCVMNRLLYCITTAGYCINLFASAGVKFAGTVIYRNVEIN